MIKERNLYGADNDIQFDVLSTQEQRNLIYSKLSVLQSGTPNWTNWTVTKAVKDGMAASVWVYRSVSMVANAGAQVPMHVVDAEGEAIPNHPANEILNKPNNQISRLKQTRLLLQWIQLSGAAYLLKDTVAKRLTLWPVAPDRIAPIPSKDNDMIITGYAKRGLTGAQGQEKVYEPDEIIPFGTSNPANPIEGLGPLQAAAKVVDTDQEQLNWNKSSMQNRGVPDGFISFKTEVEPDQMVAIEDKIHEKWSGAANARKKQVLGAEATFVKMANTPIEMDFLDSRSAARDEILASFGVPSQLANAQESSTYDNLRASEVILWRNTIMPILDDMADTYTFDFTMMGLLNNGQRIAADYSGVSALQQNTKERAEAGEKFFKMGVPFKQINTKLKLGIDEFEGDDKPFAGRDVAISVAGNTVKPTGDEDTKRATRRYVLRETRSIDDEIVEREQLAEARAVSEYEPVLTLQQDATFAALVASMGEGAALDQVLISVQEAIVKTQPAMAELVRSEYVAMGTLGATNIIVEIRAPGDSFEDLMEEALQVEGVILQEVSLIQQSTANAVISQVADGLNQGLSVTAIQQAIIDVGTFSPERALRLSRTITGSAQSIGQLVAGSAAGATVKVWHDAGANVRDKHQARDGEKAPIDGRFLKVLSENGVAPRFPLDPQIHVSDRVNCRCAMTFEV